MLRLDVVLILAVMSLQADNVAAAAGGMDERSFLDGLQATAPVAGALPHASPALHLQLLSACAP